MGGFFYDRQKQMQLVNKIMYFLYKGISRGKQVYGCLLSECRMGSHKYENKAKRHHVHV